MFTLLNSALRTPCGGFHRAGILHHQSDGFAPRAPLNRVPSGCSTGVECLFLFHWGSMLYAPCAMLAIPLGPAIPTQGFSKSSTNAVLVELFYGYIMHRKENSFES